MLTGYRGVTGGHRRRLIDGALTVNIWGNLNIRGMVKKLDRRCWGRQAVGATTGKGPKGTVLRFHRAAVARAYALAKATQTAHLISGHFSVCRSYLNF